MDEVFLDQEKLYRAVYPPEISEIFWRKDGSISSAAFADPKGLSVDRGYFRSDNEVVNSMKKRFSGKIIYVLAETCNEVAACIKYLPSKGNIYHSEIHGSETVALLSKHQRRKLADAAVLLAW